MINCRLGAVLTANDKEKITMDHQDWLTYTREYGSAMLLFARQYVHSVPDAESIVQEAFLRLWKRGVSDKYEVKKQLYMYTKCAALDYLRSESRRKKREERYAETFSKGVAFFESSVDKQEIRQEVEKALAQLPEEQREVLVMKVWGELTFKQISEVLETSQGTIASRYRLGLEALRKQMSKEVYYG